MGCCMSHVPPPMPEVNEMNKVGSYTETTKPTEPKKFAHKPGKYNIYIGKYM